VARKRTSKKAAGEISKERIADLAMLYNTARRQNIGEMQYKRNLREMFDYIKVEVSDEEIRALDSAASRRSRH